MNIPTVLFALYFVIGLTSHIVAQSSNVGYVMGSVAFVREGDSGSPEFAAKVKIAFEGKWKVIQYTTNDAGDFSESLKSGNYCLRSVRDQNDNSLRISNAQRRCFKILKGKTFRLDIILDRSNNPNS